MTTTETRLSFRLPDFTRYSWVSDKARAVWEPRIQQVLDAWTELEWRSVAEGQRACTLRVVAPEDFLSLAPRMAQHGLTVLPLSMQGVSAQPYSNTATTYQAGAPFVYHAVIGQPHQAAEFREAYQGGDQDTVGSLLGYPECCRKSFQRVWVEEQRIDTTWSMAINTETRQQNGLTCEVFGPLGSNILLRWLGIRAVPHLPCAFDCDPTVVQAKGYIKLGRKLGYESEMEWLEEMLSWPVEWSALHGIAEIKTPVIKIASCSDATAEKCVVQRPGTSYPAEGAQGLVFPYRQPVRLAITDSKSFKRGLEYPLPPAIEIATRPAWYYTDNGFPSLSSMEQNHRPILDLVASTLNGTPAAVLDLGCGNGALLRQICERSKLAIPYGIDRDASSIAHAHELHPERAQNFVVGDMFDSDQLWTADHHYALALLMPGRLLEMDPERATQLLQRIAKHSDRLLIYAYDDWLANCGGLVGLARQTGLAISSDLPDQKASFAVVTGFA